MLYSCLQYVLIRLVSTAVALALQLGHLYTEGDFDPKRGYLWITVVTCCSQSWALYVLVLFYRWVGRLNLASSVWGVV